MIHFDELCEQARNQPPSGPRLAHVEHLARRRSRRNLAAVLVVAVLSIGGVSVLIPEDEPAGETNAAGQPPSDGDGLPRSLRHYLQTNRGILPAHTQPEALDAQDPALDLDQVVVFDDIADGLTVAMVTTTTRSDVCMLEISATATGVSCVPSDEFEESGIVVFVEDPRDGIFETVALLPMNTTIGFIDEGVVHPSKAIVTWTNWNHQANVRIEQGTITLDTTDGSLPATTVVPDDPLLVIFSDKDSDLQISHPPTWNVTTTDPTPNAGLTFRVAISTYPLPAGGGGGCAHLPVTALNRMTSTDVFIHLEERDPVGTNAEGFGERPDTFAGELNRIDEGTDAWECIDSQQRNDIGTLRWIDFQDNGRGFYLLVAVGTDASGDDVGATAALLDSLTIG